MALSQEGQIEFRGLLMGPGTDYTVTHFNPFARVTRADYSGTNPYADGGWSGPEFLEPVSIPLHVHVSGGASAGWWQRHAALQSALRPVRNDPSEPEIHWRMGGRDYMMYARPRTLEPEIKNMMTGDVTTACALVALDPSIYSGGDDGLHSLSLGLYHTIGGLSVPLGLPFTIRSVVAGGLGSITNIGETPSSLAIRINGPVVNPMLTVSSNLGGNASLWFETTLQPGEWLEIDTQARSVLKNGFISMLAVARGTFPLAWPGENEVRYMADDYNDESTAEINWRDRW